MRDLKKNKSVTVISYLQICRNGCFWNKQKQFSMKKKLFPNGNSAMDNSHRPQIHKKYRSRNPFKVSATLVPNLDQNRKRLFINDLIPCSGTQVTPKRPNTLSNRFTKIDHRSTHRCLSHGGNPREGNSPWPQPNSYLEQFIMQKKEMYISFS